MYLPIYLDTAFKLPATLDDGSKISKDDFVNGLQADTVRYSADTGLIRGTVGQMLSFFVQVELDEGEGLAVALRWIRRALYLTDLSTDLIKMAAQRSLSRVPAAVRDGPGIAHTLKLGLDFDVRAPLSSSSSPLSSLLPKPILSLLSPSQPPPLSSPPHLSSPAQVPNTNSAIEHSIRQQPFLTKLLSRLETATGSDAVLNDLRELRAILIHPSRMNIFTGTRQHHQHV